MTQIKKQILTHEHMNYGVYDHSIHTLTTDLGAHWHPEYELNYIYQGPITIFQNGRNYTLNSNELLITNKNVIHSCTDPIEEDRHFVSILFGEEFIFPGSNDPIYQKYLYPLEVHHLGFPDIITCSTPGGNEILHSVRNFLNIYTRKNIAFEMDLRSELLHIFQTALEHSLFVECHDNASSLNTIVQQSLLTMQQNYMYPLSIEKLAAAHHITHSYFCRLFKSSIGKGPLAYLLDYRISIASSLLIQTDDPISSIAYSCGFDDTNYFARCFKQKKGLSPSEYRKRSLLYTM